VGRGREKSKATLRDSLRSWTEGEIEESSRGEAKRGRKRKRSGKRRGFLSPGMSGKEGAEEETFGGRKLRGRLLVPILVNERWELLLGRNGKWGRKCCIERKAEIHAGAG